METLPRKMRISVLWLCMAVAMSAHSLFGLMERDVAEMIWEMQMGSGMLTVMSLMWIGPLIMAVLSLTLKDSANRWTNIVLGIVFTLFNIWHLVEHVTTGPMVHQLLIIASTVVFTGLIAWSAWRWPGQER